METDEGFSNEVNSTTSQDEQKKFFLIMAKDTSLSLIHSVPKSS